MDLWLQRAAIILLGFALVMGLCLGGLLAWSEKGVPDFIIGVTNLAGGALAGVLVLQQRGRDA